jgi:ABC-type molybdate transport system substrate-binding protein
MQIIYKIVSLGLVVVLAACASMGSGTKAEKQQAIRTMKDSTLTQLFKTKPDTRTQVMPYSVM